MFALVGVNGAGKSTLFKAIMGFAPAQRGEIIILGMSRDAALRKNLVAYVPQAEEVDWSFPVLVEDVVMMGRYGHMGLLRIARRADHAAVEAARRPPRHRWPGLRTSAESPAGRHRSPSSAGFARQELSIRHGRAGGWNSDRYMNGQPLK